MESRIQTDIHTCYRCKTYVERADKHHCLNGQAYRDKCEEDGLFVYMHHQCHMMVHNKNAELRRYKAVAQTVFEKEIGTREEFMERYGKSYL